MFRKVWTSLFGRQKQKVTRISKSSALRASLAQPTTPTTTTMANEMREIPDLMAALLDGSRGLR